MTQLDEKKQLEKRINRQMNQTITQKVIKVLLVICLFLAGGYFGLDALFTSFNYNPFKEERFLERSEWNEEEAYDFNAMMEIFIKTYYPGYLGFVTSVEDTGFGTYKVNMNISRYSSIKTYPGLTNAVFNIKHNKITSVEFVDKTEYILYREIYEFDDPTTQEDNRSYFDLDGTIESKKEEILEFPDSSMIEVSLSFVEFFTPEKLVEIMNMYDADYYWAAIEKADNRGTFGLSDGFSLFDPLGYEETEETKEKYPDLISTVSKGEETAEMIKNRYISQLQLFIDRPNFTKMMTRYLGTFEISYDGFAKRLELAKEEINIYGLRIVAKKDVLLQMIDELDISHVNIKNVAVSRYSY